MVRLSILRFNRGLILRFKNGVIQFKKFNERKQSNVTNLNRIVSRGQSYSNCLRQRNILSSPTT